MKTLRIGSESLNPDSNATVSILALASPKYWRAASILTFSIYFAGVKPVSE